MTTHYYPGSLTNQVIQFVGEKGMATLSEVAAAYPDHTKKQIHDALSNARFRKKLKVILRGSFRGKRESVWALDIAKPTPRGEEPSGPVASVWDLGTPRIKGDWPPKFDGGRAFNLLGPWVDPEEASNDSRKAA